MCITEYNEKAFVGGIRAEGRAEGQSDLVNVIGLLRDGKTEEEILAMDYDQHTIDLAQAVK